MGFEPHSTINIKWISIPVDHHCVGNRLRFSFVDRREKDSFVYIVTSGRSILVALCVVCLEAWLKLSYVETHQNQNGSCQRGAFAIVAVRSH
jgi:predicted permease